MKKYIVILLLFVFLLPVNVARAGFMDKIVRPISDTRMQPLYGLASHLLAKEGVSLSEWEFIRGLFLIYSETEQTATRQQVAEQQAVGQRAVRQWAKRLLRDH